MDPDEAEDPELAAREREQFLAVLKCVAGRRLETDESEYLVIKGARDAGVTWKQVAEALGVNSPQRAQQRFDRLAVVLGRSRAGAWWLVDHHKSDREYHAFCRDCYRQIPGFLVQSASEIAPPYLVGGDPAQCEGCGKTAPVRPSPLPASGA